MLRSKYYEMFGESVVGRPPLEENPVGLPTGDRRLTERARRRATRVLKVVHRDEFERLMREEILWLMENGDEDSPE